MLKSLKTKCFRKLTDHAFEFGPGLQVIRGANEEGKSTILEAIGYALGGVKACREELAAVVTWGQPDKALKVELVLAFDGVDYTIKRSKSGAEITYGDSGRVVGQTECTAFVERLLGVGQGTIPRLMLAPQGAIRGALDEGSKATMALIEALADFGIIDEVVDLIQSKLITGPATSAEDRVTRAEAAVVAAKAGVTDLDTDTLTASMAGHTTRIAAAQALLDTMLTTSHTLAKAAVDAAQAAKQRRDMLKTQLSRCEENRKIHAQQQKDAVTKSWVRPEPVQIAALQAQIDSAESAAQLVKHYERVQLMSRSYPEQFWEGDADSLTKAVFDAGDTVARLQTDQAQVNGDIKSLQAQKSGGDLKCKSCGQELPDAAAMAKHDADIQDQIDGLHARHGGIATALQAARDEHAALVAVQRSAADYDRAAFDLEVLLDIDRNFVPCILKWKGDAPVVGVGVAALRAQLTALQKQEQEAAAAEARAQALAQTLSEDDTTITNLQGDIAACGQADNLQAVRIAFDEVNAQYQQKVGDITESRYEITRIRQELAVVTERHEQQLRAVMTAEQEQQRAQNDLKTLEFNNALLKRVRAARPIIADKLWTIVLSAVSAYFSAMRGETSTVTRQGNEFLVNGKPIGGLSGSTLDILGLAIRLALTRTFLPNTPFLILDEPAAAMDDERTDTTLGFLVSAGFQQTLLVTHEEKSEAVANNIITIQ